ncbi:uncharacterized protein ACHE_30771S [Aspergillus chevalieri]|uniref:Uncharacterized protein n=1 Tax=Aspergillus chevalieri TaxID=182096 RepID=A0A7R7VMQ7_ASPCH|nr:uncharacterized protein ACHE_30771S [Aspergillus chevalieri]BCR86784.1 hypothetical protein ACHE_30771S [Aspergillus chevalieri]
MSSLHDPLAGILAQPVNPNINASFMPPPQSVYYNYYNTASSNLKRLARRRHKLTILLSNFTLILGIGGGGDAGPGHVQLAGAVSERMIQSGSIHSEYIRHLPQVDGRMVP